MNVRLEAIKLNHDPESATSDALNIRKNETQPVTPPEWRRGISVMPEDSPAAYAIRETRGNTLTIEAKFSSQNSANAKAWVRAVEARPQHRQALGCNPIGALLRIFSLDRSTRTGNVLGEVKQRQIELKATGETDYETFELQNVRLWHAGISVSNTEWRWQFRTKPADHWTDFAVTRHRIYTVLEIPKCPWEQTPHTDGNTQLPWADALEYACDWAAGAQNTDEAATKVTRGVNDLGLDRVSYSGSSLYSCPNFNCTQFLNLLNGGRGKGERLNCSDCATAVSSFSNLLGCDLRQLQLGPDEIPTQLIKKIGDTTATKTEFFGHEVAWKGNVTEQGRIFDACLHLDGDAEPATPPFVPLLPTNIPFGRIGEKHYRFRLSSNLILRPETLACRKIGYSVAGDCRKLTPKQLEFLKVRYDFASWSDRVPDNYPLASDDDSLELKLSGWRLKLPEWTVQPPVEEPKFTGSVRALQSLWFAYHDPDLLLRLDAFDLQTWEEAREFMLRELGEFHQLTLRRLIDPSIGDVSFVEIGDESVIFARAQFVMVVRSVGKKSISVRQTATKINQLLS